MEPSSVGGEQAVYPTWSTGELFKATYNYQFVTKSPGANAHHPTLAVELRYDIFSDFGTKVNIELA
jgi:hypothetical protein